MTIVRDVSLTDKVFAEYYLLRAAISHVAVARLTTPYVTVTDPIHTSIEVPHVQLESACMDL